MHKKILDIKEAIEIGNQLKNTGEKIVLVGGCFDILHPGHLFFLEKAKKEGETLVVALESDERIKKIKGRARPKFNQKTRALNLLKTNLVDYIIMLPETSPIDYEEVVNNLRPAIIALTEDDPKQKIKEKLAKTVGGEIRIIKKIKGYSTTSILEHENTRN